MEEFGIDEKHIQATDGNDRFKRPISVAIFGCLMSAGIVALMVKESDVTRTGGGVVGLAAFTLYAFASSVAYAFIGWRWSRALAHRIFAIVGGATALGGLAVLLWILLVRVPGSVEAPISAQNPNRHHVNVDQP